MQKLLTEAVRVIAIVTIVVAHVELAIVIPVHVHRIAIRIEGFSADTFPFHRLPYARLAGFPALCRLCLENLFP